MKNKKNNLNIKNLFSKSIAIYKENWFNIILIILILSLVGIFSEVNVFGMDRMMSENIFETAAIINLLVWFVSTYLSIGFIRYIMKLIKGESAKIKNIFHGVDSIEHFVFVVIVSLLVGMITLLGSLLFIIPGLIIGIGLIFAKFIIIENKGGEIEIVDALKKSWEITKGYKWKLLWIGILVILFNLLGLFALGIGLLITAPVSLILMVLIYKILSEFADETSILETEEEE